MPRAIVDITGQRFGKLVALSVAGKSRNKEARWLCQCDCGKTTITRSSRLRSGGVKSCGCLPVGGRPLHGMWGTPTHKTWGQMFQRCYNPKSKAYKNYGGRGITVCERWNNFQNFLSDMGEKPLGLMIDRINNDGNYEPGNCRWATWKEQNNNRRPRSRAI